MNTDEKTKVDNACVLTVTEKDINEFINSDKNVKEVYKKYFEANPTGDKVASAETKMKLLTKAHIFFNENDFVSAMVYAAMASWIIRVDKGIKQTKNLDNVITEVNKLYKKSRERYIDMIRQQVKSAAGKDDAPPLNIIESEKIKDLADNPLTYENIVGMESEKQTMMTKFIYPNKFPFMFTTLKNNVLMYGPPGTGKTFLAKGSVLEFEESGGTGVIFIEATAAELRSKWEGGTEDNIKQLWLDAQAAVDERKKAEGKEYKAILFLDEIEAIAADRSEKPENSRAVTTLLQVMDGIASEKTKDVMVMAATNLPWSLDPAMLRRLPGKIMVGLPDYHARITLFAQTLVAKFFKDEYNRPMSDSDFKDRLKNAIFIRENKEEIPDSDTKDNQINCKTTVDKQQSFACYLSMLKYIKPAKQGAKITPKQFYVSELKRYHDKHMLKINEAMNKSKSDKKRTASLTQQKEIYEAYHTELDDADRFKDVESNFMDPINFQRNSYLTSKDDEVKTEFDEELEIYTEKWNEMKDGERKNPYDLLDDYFKLFALYHFGHRSAGVLLLVKYIHYLGDVSGPQIATRIYSGQTNGTLFGKKASRYARTPYGFSNSDINNFMNDFYGIMATGIINRGFEKAAADQCKPLCDVIKGSTSCDDDGCQIESSNPGPKRTSFGNAIQSDKKHLNAMFLTENGENDMYVTYREKDFDIAMAQFKPTITHDIVNIWQYDSTSEKPDLVDTWKEWAKLF
jgi:ATP-dependent 26S proteasome regulatory subunit